MNALVLIFAAVFARPMEEVRTLDPVEASAVNDCRAINLIYETPLEIDYAERPYKLIPGLCELPTISEDKLVYRFKLIENAPVNVVDIKRNLLRLKDENHATAGSWTMSAVKEIKVLNENEFEIRLKYPQSVFPWMLAMTYTSIRLESGAGTGPYRLKHWWKGHEMTFVKNPAWRGWAKNPNGFDEIRYHFIKDVSTQWLMFLKGEIDMLGEVSRDNWDAIVDGNGKIDPELERKGVKLHGMPKMEVAYIGFNMRDEVVGKNKYLRQALNAAFDHKTWEEFYNNRVISADGPVPPGVNGATRGDFKYFGDTELAKALLVKAGYPGGIDPKTGRRLVLTLSMGQTTQDMRESGELLASFYDKIGIKLVLNYSTWSEFLRSVDEGRVQLYRLAWIGDYPDAENFLQLFYSPNVCPGSNRSCFNDAEYDRAYKAGDWKTCQEILREECPWIFAHYSKSFSLVGPRVGNYIPSDFPYGQEKWYEVKKAEGQGGGKK